MKQMMKCGHVSNGITAKGTPICVICNCSAVSDVNLEISNRMAKCIYCDNIQSSSLDLPFYKHHPDHLYDSYYCGCDGWD